MAGKPTGPKGGTYRFTPGGLVRLDIYLSPETKERLRELAFHEHKSMSELATQAVEDFLDRQARKTPKK